MRHSLLLLPLLTCFLPAILLDRSEAQTPGPIDQLADEMHHGMVFRNDSGEVVGFQASSHKGKIKANPDGRAFQDADITVLEQYPSLVRLELEKPVLTPGGMERIAEMSQIEELELWSIQPPPHLKDQLKALPPAYLEPLDALKHLRKLDFKHNRIEVEALLQLGNYPQLETLVLDGQLSEAVAIPFIERNPTLKELHLHRTNLSNEEFGRIIRALPQLERLQLKPANQKPETVGGRGLRHLQNARHLREISLSHKWDEVPYEDGLSHLVGVPGLKLVKIDIGEGTERDALLQRLSEERPDLLIMGKGVAWYGGELFTDRQQVRQLKEELQLNDTWQAH